jgi:4-carboxymuconolactone decarboxylase
MPRIPFIKRNEASEEQRRIAGPIWDIRGGHDSDHYGGPWGIMLHNAELTEHAAQYGTYVRAGAGLPKRLSELVIAITARHWNCQFEWSAHHHQALQHGVPPELVEAIRTRAEPVIEAADEQAVYDYVSQLYAEKRVSGEAHARAVDAVGEACVIAIVAIAGFYSSVAMICNAFDLEVSSADPPPPLVD